MPPGRVQADTLRQDLLSAGVEDVEVVSEAEAATALVRSTDADAAVLLVDDDTATLTIVDADRHGDVGAGVGADRRRAVRPSRARRCWRACPRGRIAPVRVMLVGHRDDLESVAAGLRDQSSVPVELPTDASFAIARGAAQTVGLGRRRPGRPGDAVGARDSPEGLATQMAPVARPRRSGAAPRPDAATALGAGGGTAAGLLDGRPRSPLADYGDEPYEMPMDPLDDLIPEQDADATEYTPVVQPVAPRMVLMGSAIAFVVVSFATLAVTACDQRPAHGVGHRNAQRPPCNPTPCRGATCLRFRTHPTRWPCRSRC